MFSVIIMSCSSSGGSSGTAPTISSLLFTPSTIYVNDDGGQTDIFGTFDFSDPDGYLWEVAYADSWAFNPDGSLVID